MESTLMESNNDSYKADSTEGSGFVNARCSYCDAEVETGFDRCWNCGRDLVHGTLEDDVANLPQTEHPPNQFSIRSLLMATIAIALVAQACLGEASRDYPLIRVALLGIGIVYLYIWAFAFVAATLSKVLSYRKE